VDHAKGFCIVLVVMLYANELVEHTAGHASWLDAVVAFARPFRMPDFFLVSGVLLTLAIGRDWRTFVDRKVFHFAYFYVLWLTILVAFEAPWTIARAGWTGVGALYIGSFVNPYSMLWFIYLLALFFVATKAVARAPAALVWLLAAALQVAQIDSGVKVLDKFAGYYVFFYSGYLFAAHWLRFAEAVRRAPALALAALGAWAAAQGWLVFAGYAWLPGVSLALGLTGAGAVISIAALMSKTRFFAPIAYCGRNSIVIYLAFTIPLAVAAKLLFSTGWVSDTGWIATLATAAAVAGALAFHRIVKQTRCRFLFERPARLRLAPQPRAHAGAARPA
jgi:uncharacterized membrane protein YcfT